MISTQVMHNVVLATGGNQSIVSFLLHEIAAPFTNYDSDRPFHLCKSVTAP